LCDNVFSAVSFVLCNFVIGPSLFHFSREGKINTRVMYLCVKGSEK
jgi:hypothetical protein